MTPLLKKALRAVRDLPEEKQNQIAARILDEVTDEARGERGRVESADWAGQAIQQATGRATRELTTNEILALTRESFQLRT